MSLNLLFFTPVEVLTGVLVALLFGVPIAAIVGIAGGLTRLAGRSLGPIGGGAGAATITAGALTTTGLLSASTVQPGIVLGLGLVALLGLYATSQGHQRASELPRATIGSITHRQSLSADAIDAVDAMGQVTIRSTGSVRELDGYPPLDPERRHRLAEGAWRLPADLPLSALETRLEARLRTEYDLDAVSVSVDGRGRATITAAPPTNQTAVPDGWRAVSVRALLPAGLTAGDDVTIVTDETAVSGVVRDVAVGSSTTVHDGAIDWSPTNREPAIAPIGAMGRVTVIVPTTDVPAVLAVDRARIVVKPRGPTHAFDAVSVIERAGTRVRQVLVTDSLLAELADDSTTVDVVAVRDPAPSETEANGDGWRFNPNEEKLEAGTEAFVVGTDVPNTDRPGADRSNHDAEPIAVGVTDR